MSGPTGRFRVRRGWFGKSILQELYDTPSFNGGHIDASTRQLIWFDVDYDKAPRALVSEFKSELQRP